MPLDTRSSFAYREYITTGRGPKEVEVAAYKKLGTKEKRDAVRDDIAGSLADALKQQNVQLTQAQLKAAFEAVALNCDSCDFACKHFIII